MTVWQMEDATSRLSEVIDEACCDGPQILVRHDAECAVVLSIADYRALTAIRKPDLRQYLLGGPKVDSFNVKREPDTKRKGQVKIF